MSTSLFESDRSVDVLDQASQLEEHERVAARKRLALPTHFTERPDENTDEAGGYHRYCLDCGCEISPKRVALLPFSVRCVDCQTLLERNGRQYAQPSSTAQPQFDNIDS